MMNKHTSIGTSIARLAWPVVAPDLREWAESVEHKLGGVVFAIEVGICNKTPYGLEYQI